MAYWINDGVLTFKGKDIKKGEKLPTELDRETVSRLIKSGKAAESMPTVEVVEAGNMSVQLADMTDAAKRAIDRITELEKLLAESQGALTAANATVAELTAQLMAPQPHAGAKK